MENDHLGGSGATEHVGEVVLLILCTVLMEYNG